MAILQSVFHKLKFAFLLTGCFLAVSCGDSPDVVTVQLRWCVVEGSSEAEGLTSGSLIQTTRTARFEPMNVSDIWGKSGILFFALAHTDKSGKKVMPVIGDPVLSDDQEVGDIKVSSPFEASLVAAACDASWQQLDPNAKGPVVVTVRKFTGDNGVALAAASSPKKSLWVKQASPLTGKRDDDLCGEPRNLTSEDVFNLSPSNGSGQGWVVLQQASQYAEGVLTSSFAHELGHLLFLGHGNGYDDNGDGLVIGNGARRFDAYCDPMGTSNGKPVEDNNSNGCSIMDLSAGCNTITPLQIEMARAVAIRMPGCSGSACISTD